MPARGVAVGTAVGDGGAGVELEAGVGGSVDVAKPGIVVERAGAAADVHPRISSADNPDTTPALNIQ
jgi:hypothetical protein